MDTYASLLEWIKKMGYDGAVPTSLTNICNTSTGFIWDQIVSNIKPRQEVDQMRKNLIIDKLKNDNGQSKNTFEEMEIFLKKQNLEKKLKNLQDDNNKTELAVDDLLHENKMKYVQADNVKEIIEENKEITYLLDKKSKMLKNDISRCTEMLAMTINLTSNGTSNSSNSDDINEVLCKCAQKFAVSIKELATVSAKTNFDKTTNSIRKMHASSKKGTMSGAFSGTKNRKCLQWDECNKTNYETHEVNQKTKRESLGILPLECIRFNNECIEESAIACLNNEPYEAFVSNINQSYLSFIPSQNGSSIFEKLEQDQYVTGTIQDLLHTNNKLSIINNCKTIYEDLMVDLRKDFLKFSNVESHSIIEKNDITKLCYNLIKKELDIVKFKTDIQKTQEVLKKHKREKIASLIRNLINKNRVEEVKTVFELQLEDTKLETTFKLLNIEISSCEKVKLNELQVISSNTKQINDEIIIKNDMIQECLENIRVVLDRISRIRVKSLSCIERLNYFISDMTFIDCLNKNVLCNEIELFSKFPLKFNRKFSYIGMNAEMYYRDIPTNSLSNSRNIDSNCLHMITSLLDCPYSPAESILLNVLELKTKLQNLQQLSGGSSTVTFTKSNFSMDENYIERVVNKLHLLINSSSFKEVLETYSSTNKIMDQWLEMSVKDFISDTRLVDGQNYKFYGRKIDRF